MKKTAFFFLLLLPFFLNAQLTQDETDAIGVVKRLFDGMRASDSNMVRSTFHPRAQLQTTLIGADGKPRLVDADINRFVASIGAPKEQMFDERIWSYDVRIDQGLASVWTEYTFYIGNTMSHCGVNAFHLFKDADGWKIIQITDTRRKEGCLPEEPDRAKSLHALIDGWHKAAAVADEDALFGAMAPDGVYIGTDASERWLRDELKAWAKSAFERESAWAFTSRDRRIMVSSDARHAWWDELLDTWMGVCRASGVLVYGSDGWKINHFQLSLAVPNEKIEKFKKMVGKK
ncbi:MAG: nuclear transport factor 2 family protein [Haliscomenobacter sp.]|nr:nuclear transport factor 2 family protein [Haliscomenobacter sp.]